VKLISGVPFALAIAAMIAAGVTEALAQATGPRQGSGGPRRGGKSDATARQKLDLTLSSTEAYDADVVPETGTTVVSRGGQLNGYSTMVGGSADYAWQGHRVQVRATGTSTMRYNRPLDAVVYSLRSVSHSGAIGVSARLAKLTTLLVNQTATYSPSSLYNLFPQAPATMPGDAPTAAPDYAIDGSESHSYGTALTLTHEFARRSSVSATADYQNTDTLGILTGRRSLSSYGIKTHLSHHLSANTAVIAEYLYHTSEGRGGGTPTGETFAEHRVNIGADYRRPLSARRRVTFGVLFGLSTTRAPESAVVDSAVSDSAVSDSAVSDSAVLDSAVLESVQGVGVGGGRSRMSGQVTMGYQFAPTWKVNVIYHRGVDYAAGLSTPTFGDSFTSSVDGLLTRHLNFLASAGYSSGESAFSRNRSIFETYTGDVRLRYMLTSKLGASVEYLYYFYGSRGSMPLSPGIPSALERKGVRAGLTLLVPALRR
jgi:hypothetical protein